MRLIYLLLIVISMLVTAVAGAEQYSDPRQQAMSDTLDLWREGRFEQVYDGLSHRNGMTRERFAEALKEAEFRPACCFAKLNNFRVVSEKRTTAKVYATLGMEGGPGSDSKHSREFTMDHEEGRWKLRMADIKALAGMSKKKSRKSHLKKL